MYMHIPGMCLMCQTPHCCVTTVALDKHHPLVCVCSPGVLEYVTWSMDSATALHPASMGASTHLLGHLQARLLSGRADP
jgi:hypothetical protein